MLQGCVEFVDSKRLAVPRGNILLMVSSSIPPAAGLSSSSALVVATAMALLELWGIAASPNEVAEFTCRWGAGLSQIHNKLYRTPAKPAPMLECQSKLSLGCRACSTLRSSRLMPRLWPCVSAGVSGLLARRVVAWTRLCQCWHRRAAPCMWSSALYVSITTAGPGTGARNTSLTQ
jgi:hypothetical protein